MNGVEITDLIIPDSLTSIRFGTFSNCTGLRSVTIPNSVIEIRKSAFLGCSNLASVNIPIGVNFIGNYAFKGCTNLTSIQWDAKNYPDITDVEQHPFHDVLSYITEFKIGDDVEQVPNYLCYKMDKLTSIYLGKNVTKIGYNTFDYCTGLSSVTWDLKTYPNLYMYEKNPFHDALSSITEFIFGDDVEQIPQYLCISMRNLAHVTIGKNITTIRDDEFKNCNAITSVTWNAKSFSIPSGSQGPFYNSRENITEFIFGDEVEQIPNGICSQMTGITELTISNSVTTIGVSAFGGCSGLTSVFIPNSVTSIGSAAFDGCSGLTSVTFPNSVIEVGKNAFYRCSSLQRVDISDLTAWCDVSFNGFSSNPLYNAKHLYLNNEEILELNIPNSVTEIKNYTFTGAEFLTSISIPDAVTSIGAGAFNGCCSLTSITIPDAVTTIGSEAFGNCGSLTSITIPDAVTTIGSQAFMDCSSLESIFMPNSVTEIAGGLFSGCSSLTNFTMPDKITTIGANAFKNCSSLASITIPSTVESIGAGAFANCTNLRKVEYNAISCTYPYTRGTNLHPFFGCSNFQELTIGDKAKIVPSELCIKVETLKYVKVGKSVTLIDEDAFKGCTGITSIVWNAKSYTNDTVIKDKDMTYHPFYDALDNITDFEFGDDAQKIPDYLCHNMPKIQSITIPKWVTSIGDETFTGCSGLKTVTWNAISCSSANFYSCPINTFNFGDRVNIIPAYVLAQLYDVKSITIPNSVKTIGEFAFAKSGLTSLDLGKSVTTIGGSAFYGCRDLETVTIHNQVSQIGGGAFHECSALKNVNILNLTAWCKISFESPTSNPLYYAHNLYLNGDLIRDLIIPNAITSIKDYAFVACQLESMTIPVGVTSISTTAFKDCTVHSITWNPKKYQTITKREDVPFTNLKNNYLGQITEFKFGNEVLEIPNYLCQHMACITELTIPNSVISIGDWAFEACEGLKSVSIPHSVRTLGIGAFYGCSGLSSVNIGDGIKKISESAFRNCEYLSELHLGNNIQEIDYAAFDGTRVSEIIIPRSVRVIRRDNFYAVDRVTIHNTLDSLHMYALHDVRVLTIIGYGEMTKWPALFGPIYYRDYVPNKNLSKASRLIIGCGITSLGDLEITSPVVKSYAETPPSCTSRTFDANYNFYSLYTELHTPPASSKAYCEAEYWKNFQYKWFDSYEKIKLRSNTTVNMKRGQTLQLVTEKIPIDGELICESWNNDVVTIDENGRVTAVGLGETRIDVRLANNTAVYAKCNIKVTDGYVPGDVNGDAQINANDIAIVVNVIAGLENSDDYLEADVNGDGVINATDIAAAVNIIAGTGD